MEMMSLQRGATSVIQLTSSQAVKVHGWSAPRCCLTWNHILKSDGFITARRCLVDAQIPPSELKRVQPSAEEWVSAGLVTFADVPLMTQWPLCPVRHLGGDLCDIIENGYSPETLLAVGITYDFLRSRLFMQDDAIRFLKFDPKGWCRLGMQPEDADNVSEAAIRAAFGTDRRGLRIALGMASSEGVSKPHHVRK